MNHSTDLLQAVCCPRLSIGESLEGHAFFSSPRLPDGMRHAVQAELLLEHPRLDIHFGQNKAHTQLCSMILTEERAKALHVPCDSVESVFRPFKTLAILQLQDMQVVGFSRLKPAVLLRFVPLLRSLA